MVSLLLMMLVPLVSASSAEDRHHGAYGVESALFQELAERGEIHVDTREPPLRRDIDDWQNQKRQIGDIDNSVVPTTIMDPTKSSTQSRSQPPSATSIDTSATSLAPDATVAISTETAAPLSPFAVSTSVSPTVTVVTTPLPSPFDTNIGSNFTDSSCPRFFSRFLSNATFQSCVPVSLLLQNSNSFFRAERSATLLTQTLDAACNAPLAICSPLLANIASDLIDDAHCGQDYRDQNPLVAQAYAGLVAYEAIYRATCLRDATTNSYCFAEAITNSNNSADSYVYFTALGMSMPASAQPRCTPCLKDTMKIFSGYAEDKAQPLSRTYLPCAGHVDAGCGADFVATNIKAGSTGHSSGASSILHNCRSSCSMGVWSMMLMAVWSILLY